MEAVVLLLGAISIPGNAILGIWCCIWGSDRRKAAGLLLGWALVTAIVIPLLFFIFSSEPIMSGSEVILWTYYLVGSALFVYFLKMVISSDHIRNS